MTMRLSRRGLFFSALGAAVTAVTAPLLKAAGAVAEKPLPSIEVLYEHEGFNEFGRATGAYAQGHFDHMDFARRIAETMDCDALADIIPPDCFPELWDEDSDEPRHEEIAERFRSCVKQAYAVIEDECEDGEDGGWLFHRVQPDHPGAFPVTYLDWN